MNNDLMDGVTCRLEELFEGETIIYTDAVKQGFETPCFFVQFLEPSERPMIGPRYRRETGLCIQYFPREQDQITRELNRVADILTDGMEYIALPNGDRIRGTGRSYRMEDGVLSFFVDYNLFVIKKKAEEEPMGAASTKTELRG